MEPIESLIDLVKSFDTLAGVVAIIIFVTQFLKDKVFGELKGFGAQLVSWIVAIAIVFIGVFFNLGFLESLHGQLDTFWYIPILIGLASGLVANGVFNLKPIKVLLKAIFRLIGIKVLPELD